MVRATVVAWLSLAATLGVAACQSCRTTPRAEATEPSTSRSESPTLRVYAVSDLAGALEPCGCTKDQLGGIDHLAAFITGDRGQAKGSLLLVAGPTMFLDPQLDRTRETQDRWKSEAISGALGDLGLGAWTPGLNDWAGGAETLSALAESAAGALLAANVEGGPPSAVKSAVRDVGGLKVGLVGVTTPSSEGEHPAGIVVNDPTTAMRAALADLRAKGAKLLIGLAALPRGEALRLAEKVPELSLLIVGKPFDAGDANDAPPPPVRIGKTLVIQTSNHLQTVAVVDFFVRGDDYGFQDATGVANAEALISLEGRIHDLETRIAAWQNDPSIRPEDLAARRADLAKRKDERDHLTNASTPEKGSFFRYSLVEVRSKLGSDAKISERMAAFYRRVNDHNRTAFAGRKPPEVPRGASGYVGIEVCSSCHEEARKVWDRTPHAGAYLTLSRQFKEYNLDCVSCHVTGYEKPGGSTVTLNDSLRDVQCEACHGPGQAHAKAPEKKGLILREPTEGACAASCHHPPHVEGFDAAQAKKRILGPGHGLPSDAPWPAWANDAGLKK